MTESKTNGKTPILDFTVKLFCKIDDTATKLNDKINKLNWNRVALILLGIYAALHIIISFFHEPWYDEAVAWQISKYASLKDILLVRPHYEGHPPLWHLILLPFSRLGCPYELSLSAVSLIFSGATVALILFKAPFAKPVRIILPFTYFIFYQYGIISRPYCVMMLAFALSAITYNGRNVKPFAFVLSLFLLCLSSAYGIIIADGIATAWLIEICINEKPVGIFKNKRRLAALILLLACALTLVAEIYPAEDAYAANNFVQAPPENNIFIKLLYTLAVLPADVTVTNIFNTDTSLSNVHFQWYNLLCGLFIGIILWIAAVYCGRRKKTLLTLIIPYLLFAVFSATKYMYIHHTGIGLLLFVFWAWISVDASVENTATDFLREKIIRGVLKAGCAVFLAMSLYWSVAASIGEINSIYAIGRNEASFLKENNLTDYKIYTTYSEYYAYDAENEKYTSELLFSDLNHCYETDSILAYFDGNIFYNFNEGDDGVPYTTHKVMLSTDNTDLLREWEADGMPDVIMSFSSFREIFGDKITTNEYALVYATHNRAIWKDTYTAYSSVIFVRKELAEELGLSSDFSLIEYFMVIKR